MTEEEYNIALLMAQIIGYTKKNKYTRQMNWTIKPGISCWFDFPNENIAKVFAESLGEQNYQIDVEGYTTFLNWD